MNKPISTTILILLLILIGCSRNAEFQQDKNGQEKLNAIRVENSFNKNGTKVDFNDITKENLKYFQATVGDLVDGGCLVQTIEGHGNTNYYILHLKKWRPYSNITVLNTETAIKVNYEEKTTDGPENLVISFSLPNNKKTVVLYKNGQLVQDNIKLGYGIE